MRTCILLSTYNGRKYLKDQLSSLEFQTKPVDFLIVRDDGSNDETIIILKQFQAESKIDVKIVQGSNIGPEKSFMELMKLGLEVDANAYFFCDQDDLWLPDKIESFVRIMNIEGSPHLVVSGLTLVDKDNIEIGHSRAPRKLGFGNAVLENVATGCVSGFNRSCLEMATLCNLTDPPMHDRWVYMVATLFGRASYLDKPTVRYRQHGANVVGAAHSRLSAATRRLSRFFKMRRVSRTQIAELALVSYRDIMPAHHRETCELIVKSRQSILHRIALIFSFRCWRQGVADEFFWRILFLFNRA
jgi:glycosyltransferase involved in cell wall biosynthesis